MNSRSDQDIGGCDQSQRRHFQGLKWFLYGLACALAVDAWVVRWALSGEFHATVVMPSGYSLTVRGDREEPSDNKTRKFQIEFTRNGSTSGETNNAMRFVAEWR